MYIVRNMDTKVIVAFGEEAETTQNGILLDGVSYVEGFLDLIEHEGAHPADLTPQAYKYENGAFVRNPEYKPYVSIEDQVRELKNVLLSTQAALDFVILGGA